MNILGFSCYYHDSAAALLRDGKIVAAAEEERFTRKKHDNSFPINSIRYCLDHAKITPEEIDYVVFYEKPLRKFERILQSTVETFPKSFFQFYRAIPIWTSERLNLRKLLKKKLGYRGKVLFLEHHTSHAASCFFASPFKEALILTVDGVGEFTTTRISVGKQNKIVPIKEIQFPHSLGLLYSTFTAFLGFKVNNGEYKVMGLSPYGKPRYYERIRKLIEIKDDGSFALNLKYFSYTYSNKMFNKNFIKLFGNPRKPNTEITRYHKDIAASVQRVLEEVLFKILSHAKEITRQNNLCMAGGVALNSVCNGKIVESNMFKRIFVQPASTDAGSAIGAALYTYNQYLKKKRVYVMDNVYLGPRFSDEELLSILEKYSRSIVFKKLDRRSLIRKTAELLNENKIIGWFQGRMEFGPRALGNRSILANPRNKNMKDIINKKVKHREAFRPFAPSVLEEEADKWFELPKNIKRSPFMLFVFKVKKEKQGLIPAVTHVDGTSRIQTVSRKQNPLFYDLIKSFYKLTGVPMLLNTSFNVRGEPIVMSPEHAVKDFLRTGIDYLVINNYLIEEVD